MSALNQTGPDRVKQYWLIPPATLGLDSATTFQVAFVSSNLTLATRPTTTAFSAALAGINNCKLCDPHHIQVASTALVYEHETR
jgi:hypothetical protein